MKKVFMFIFVVIILTVVTAGFDNTQPWHDISQISGDNGTKGVDVNSDGVIDNATVSFSCNGDGVCETVNITSTGDSYFATGSGNVGINTSNPANTLTVMGDGNFTLRISTPEVCIGSDCRTRWPSFSYATYTDAVTYYNFDEAQGITVYDITGGNDGTITGTGISRVSGHTNGVLDFTAVLNDYVADSSPSGLPSGNVPKTLSAWANFSANCQSADCNIGGFGNVLDYENFQIGTAPWSLDLMVWGWGPGNDWDTGYPATSIADENWHMVTVTYDGTNTILYVDGVQQAQTSAFVFNSTNPSRIVVGNEIDLSGHEFEGQIDDFAIWDYALSAEQVLILYGGSNSSWNTSGIALFPSSTVFNIGIGTDNPTQKLHVEGEANITTKLHTPEICLAGDCRSAWPAGGAGNIESPWDNNSAQTFVRDTYPTFVNVSNLLFINGTSYKVGVGTEDPEHKLDVVGSVRINPYVEGKGADLMLDSGNSTDYNFSMISFQHNNLNAWLLAKNPSDDFIISRYDDAGDFEDRVFRISNLTGYVGIGTFGSEPTQKLHVEGEANITTKLHTPEICLAGDCRSAWPAGGAGNIESPWDNNSAQTFVRDTYPLFVNISDSLFIQNNQRVGINTTTPNMELTVVGDANITGDLYVNNESIYMGDQKLSNQAGDLIWDGVELQRRVDGVCPTGEAIVNISGNGSVECDGASGYSSGMHCGLFVESAGGDQYASCLGYNPLTSCPTGFTRLHFYFEDGHAAHFYVCIKD